MGPPSWGAFAAIVIGVAASTARALLLTQPSTNVDAPNSLQEIQGVVQLTWKVGVLLAMALSLSIWLHPPIENLLGRPIWIPILTTRWVAVLLFAVSIACMTIAQQQMGASWRVGATETIPAELVTSGLFSLSRNPIFLSMLGIVAALFLWTPTMVTGALLAGAWIVISVQVRIEEEVLRNALGDRYREYEVRVPRWLGWK